MPETRLEIRGRFVTTLAYPTRTGWPLRDSSAYIREVEPPYRIGEGVALRAPGLRTAVVFGRWVDQGGDETERLTEALRASDLSTDVDEIREW